MCRGRERKDPMYASVDSALPFSVALIFFCVLERLACVFVCALFPVVKENGFRDASAAQFVVSIFDLFVSSVTSFVYTMSSVAAAVLTGMFWAAALVALGSIVYVTYEQSPWVWTDLARGYNAFLGPFIQQTFVAGLDLLNIAFKSLVPIWNGLVYFVSSLITGYLFPAVLGEISVFRSLALSVFDFAKHLVLSFGAFFSSVVVECPAVYGDACFDLTNRTLDVMTPMADVRGAVSHLVVLTRNLCGFADPVVDILTYPFMDINLADAVHNLVNAIVYLFVQLPQVTYLRCKRFGGEGTLFCTPDFDPVYAFLVTGLRSLGSLLDNWLDIVYVVVHNSLGLPRISCDASVIPSTADPGSMRESVFGANRTVLVGLTGYLLAVTDGMVIAYEGNGKLRLGAWPSLVNVSYGVAAVTYGGGSDTDVSGLSSGRGGTSTSLLGCLCAQDPEVGMQIQCSVAPFYGLLSNETGAVPVFFQGGGVLQKALRCSDVDVVVQSVRWPATRFAGGSTGARAANVDCATTNTCNDVDATVWIFPRANCGAESALCDCYPFCMAARLASSRTAPLVFYSAAQWRGRVHLTRRDCVLHSVTPSFGGAVGSAPEGGVSSAQVLKDGVLQFVSVADGVFSCMDNLLVTTVIDRSLHPAYDAPTEPFLRNRDAPFAVTGDTILTALLHGDGSYAVRVERLTGAVGNEYTLSVVSNNFPALPPTNVPKDLFSQYPKDSLTIPYARLQTVAVSSRDYVFYAVNPSTEVFDAYLNYCKGTFSGGIDQFGIMMESSYSPIRIWRVEAYRRCSAAGCGPDLVAQADIPGAFSNGTFQGATFSSDCLGTFNKAVTQLEFVDENNVAVTVLYTDVSSSFVQYRTYWLHVRTMRLSGPGLPRTGPWTDAVPATALGAYSLCPSMQILPHLGSYVTEVAVAAVFLLRMPLDAIVYTPGIIQMWSAGPVCPLRTHGHAVLHQCGANAFSLNDFFGALQTATNIFWSIPVYVSSTLVPVDGTDFVRNVLNGVASYGAGSVDLWAVRFKVLGIMKIAPEILQKSIPTSSFFSGLASPSSAMTGVTQGGAMAQAAVQVSSNLLGWARFGYTALLKIVMTITRNVVAGTPVSASRAWRIIVNTLDEVRGDYDAYVVSNMRQSCGGIAMMTGINNPWAVFMYQQCLANVAVVQSALTVALSVFNLSPFAQCMCSGSAGKRFGAYAMQNCLPQASTTLRPVLLEMIQAASQPVVGGMAPAQMLCKSMIDYTNASLVNTVQPWFQSQYASLDALSASVDYALFWIDPTAGECLDYTRDPDVVVIMPYPSDYFDLCAQTTMCKMKCAGLWNAFNNALSALATRATQSQVTVKVESLFFPSLSADAFTPMLVMAMIEPSAAVCFRVCGREHGLCLAVAGVSGGVVIVQYYCVPTMVTANVFRTLDSSLEWQIPSSAHWGEDIAQLQFVDGDGQILVALLGTDRVILSSSLGEMQLTNLTAQTLELRVQVLRISAVVVTQYMPYACVSVNLMYRQVSGQITGQAFHRFVVINTNSFDPRSPASGVGPWQSLGGSLFFSQLQGYQATLLGQEQGSPLNVQYLLIPTTAGTGALIWTVLWDSAGVENGIVGTNYPYPIKGSPVGVDGLLSSGQILSQNCAVDIEGAYLAFAAAPSYQSTSWLTQLRISGVSAGAYSSQRVYVAANVTRSCDISSCVGCPDGEVQSLCDAMQQCAVVNCIGTRVNMRRPLCQVGQTVADYARQNLAILDGTWSIFVEIYLTLMELSLQKGVTGITLSFPDDRFFGYVCSMKDNNVHMISVVTSTLNSVISFGHSAMLYLEGGAHEIDSNFNALTAMPIVAFTGFLNQVFMGPLYALIVAQKLMMCKVNGVLAIFDASGFSMRIGNAAMQNASDSLVGQCLTQNFVVKHANPVDSSNLESVVQVVNQVSQAAAMAAFSQLTFQGITLEPLMHTIDASLSYYMGILYSMADMLQSLDLSHCKLPDYFLNETVFCACGDTPFSIPPARRREGLKELGLWCTGTLSMIDASNRPFVIYNPFTYQELQDMARGADEYLACMSSKAYRVGDSDADCHSLRPTTPQLQAQGVSVLSVLTACKRNYLNGQWDQGAHILFNQTLFDASVHGIKRPDISKITGSLAAVGKCLADADLRPMCMQYYLSSIGMDPALYWVYEDASPGPSQLVDACQVFTGPANNSALTPEQQGLFRACLDQYADSNCQLSSALWTHQSSNQIPVAVMHGVRLSNRDLVSEVVRLKYQEAHDLVMSALEPLKNYSNDAVISSFFSPEGDIMHQMLDCVFMGPYDKVNYWPSDSNGLLSVPAWFRDTNGTSRRVNPRECVKGAIDTSPPYSCGSASRQAVIKYFFRDYLQGGNRNAVLQSIIRGMVDELTEAWRDTSTYPCLCADNRTHSVACCNGKLSKSWLPPALDTASQFVPSNSIMRALTNQVEAFYRVALETPSVWTKHLDTATLQSYDWSHPAPAAVAVREALFKSDAPSIRYDGSEANSPMLNTSLWDQCHGLLSKVFFTIPMQPSGNDQWIPQNMPAGSVTGVDALERFVRAAVNGAYGSSPLYRHYNVSYVPSDSRMCRPRSPRSYNFVASPPVRSIKASSYILNAGMMMDTSGWEGLPSFGVDAFPLHGCFCGWDGNGETCIPPPAVARAIPELLPSFSGRSQAALDLIKSKWVQGWPCPALELGDQYGVMDSGEYDSWLQGSSRDYTISGMDLLKRGRSGLRVGNFRGQRRAINASVSPAARQIEPAAAVLPYCGSDFTRLAGAPLLDRGMLEAFVSGLFPVSQGVYEGGFTAYCLRYLSELAILETMVLVAEQVGNGSAVAFETNLVLQRKVVELWKVRCESQISLLALCKNLDVFQAPTSIRKRYQQCPFSIAVTSTNDVYMTPGCLVHSSGYFYDPCNCAVFACGPAKPLFTSFVPECRIPFDPRNFTADAPLGNWKTSDRIKALQPGFVNALLGTGGAVGNTPRGMKWTTAEGFLNTTGLHCDMLADWWPDGQTFPVGYHATVPCSSDDAGYQTFDSAFAVERSGGTPGEYTVVRMVYQHDVTRDESKVDTNLGAGGLCRASTFGMPLYESNTMRICTRQLKEPDALDPAIPVQYSGGLPDSALGSESCSETSSETPWFDLIGRQDSALHSVGTIPNMPDAYVDATYPPEGVFFGVGPLESIQMDLAEGGNGWGSGCSDYPIKECSTDSDCPSNYYCLPEASVCMSNDFKTAQYCYRHDMCSKGEMCDGTGQCSPGYIVYLNTLNTSMEAQVFSELCDESTSFSYATDGSSPWENVPDWLEGHGMCSNKNWYMYSINMRSVQAGAGAACTNASCPVDARRTALPLNNSLWWPVSSPQPTLFPVLPTVCDRDYEHMAMPSGAPLKGCSPKDTRNLDNQITDPFSIQQPIEFAGLFRNFEGTTTQLGRMPFLSSLNTTGFLGAAPSALMDLKYLTKYISNCNNYQNCYPYTFTFNGLPRSPRLLRVKNVLTNYSESDIFQCGVAAYYDASKSLCVLDTQVLTLYQALCKTPSVVQTCSCQNVAIDYSLLGCEPVVDVQRLDSICQQINYEYSASYETINTNSGNLQALFGVFIQSSGTLAAHLSGVECFGAIYNSMQTSRIYSSAAVGGVYYPLNFALYEIPLAWLYQCVFIGGMSISPTSTRIQCSQFEKAQTLEVAGSDLGKNYFNFDFVQGGYTREAVTRSRATFVDRVHSAMPDPASISEAQSLCYDLNLPAGQRCTMQSYCAIRQDWLPNSAMDDNIRTFLIGYNEGLKCTGQSIQIAIAASGLTFQQFITRWTVLAEYVPDSKLPNAMPDVAALLLRALDGCIRKASYNESRQWPLRFELDQTLSGCMNFDGVITDLAVLFPEIDINEVYMPTQTQISELPKASTVSASAKSCIFTNLVDQVRSYNPTASIQQCQFSSGLCPVECFKYALTYARGSLECRYPLKKQFTNFGLKSMLEYLWSRSQSTAESQLRTVFNRTFNALSPFSQPSPEPLGFFTASQANFAGWSFDMTGVQNYLSNINPDTSKAVMCMITSAVDRVNFTTCNDANYATLAAFTQSLRQKAAPVIPGENQLRWRVSRSFLERGALFAFANHTRPREKVLLSNIFDTQTRCGMGEQMQNRVCLMQVTGGAAIGVRPWVPWVSGKWNPYEYCDVQLQDLNRGNQEVIWPYDTATCPACPQLNGEYRTSYMFDLGSPSCDSRKMTYAQQVDVDPGAPTNICYVSARNSDTACTHQQGMVGGERGQSVLNHPRMPFLYGTNNLSIPAGSGGMFPRSPNTLLGGQDATPGQYGYLSVPGDELGITAIGLAIDSSATSEMPYLRVSRLPMQGYKWSDGFISNLASRDVQTGWVRSLGAAFASEDALHAAEQSSRGNSAWDCPMRRAAFYSQAAGKSFVPALPSPGRSRRIFGHLTQGRSTHPTVQMQRDGSALGQYTTSNGFCFCPANLSASQSGCLISLGDKVHNCSLKRTIDALIGSWVQSYVFPPSLAGGGDATCRMQFDWPYVGGTLRDGSSYEGSYSAASDQIKRRCHVLDRLKPFVYRYKNNGTIRAVPGTSTLNRGGVCHTGRAAQMSPAAKAQLAAQTVAGVQTVRCTKRSENDDAITVGCEDGTSMVLAKERSTPLPNMVAAVQSARASCAKCSPPPSFFSPSGAPIQAESSFGIPFRFSAERAAAADLRKLLCPNASQCDLPFNESAWTKGEFMRALLTSPSSLFLGLHAASPPASAEAGDAAWDSDWVFCNTSADLKAGKCKGSISKAKWRANRFQSCYKTIRDLTHDSPEVMSSVDVCLVDSQLNTMCEAVKRAQALVSSANCLASGSPDCVLKPFLYLPGAWATSNHEFVHQTVSRFYKRVTPYACPAVDAAVIANNQAILSRCPSSAVTVMYLALQGCRNIVNTVAEVIFYGLNILINAFQMAFSLDKSALKAQIVFYWHALVSAAKELLTTLSDLFFEMLFHMGDLGGKIYKFLQNACKFLNTAYIYWLEVWCGIAIDLAPMALIGIRHVAEYCEVAFKVLNDCLEVIFRYMVPDALRDIQGLGYRKGFREKNTKGQANEKQVIHDALVQSKKEGKSADAAKRAAKNKAISKHSNSYIGTQGLIEAAALGIAGSIMGEFKGAGLLMDLGMAAYETAETTYLLGLLPSNFTLFDFTEVFTAIDAFQYFISSDDQCLNYRSSGLQQILDCNFPALASFDSLKGAMMVATRCWADAQRDVGTSNLLACSESDTCYTSVMGSDTVVCASCPDPGAGYSPYGCSRVTQTCTCGVQTTQPDSCVSNEECYYASATCLLVTGLDMMSYGNQPCTQCTKDVQCIIRDSSGIGKCGCVFQPQPIQQCSQSPGGRLDIVAPNKVCGYLANVDMAQSLATAHWDALALAPCLYIDPSAVYCVQVYQGAAATPMAVGVRMAALTASFQSRRLLADGQVLPAIPFELNNAESEYALPNTPAMHRLLMEDWNGTAAPCSALVWAYQSGGGTAALGPLDTMYLHQCAYWRQVGRETIRVYNLTTLRKHDGFLLSVDDFAAALSQKSVLLELIQRPQALVFALGHAPLLKPLYAALLTARSLSLAVSMTVMSLHNQSGGADAPETAWNPDWNGDWNRVPIHSVWQAAWDRASKLGTRERPASDPDGTLDDTDSPEAPEPALNQSEMSSSDTGRHLMMARDAEMAQNWLTGPFSWPPIYSGRLGSQQCSAGSALVQIMHDILQVLVPFYMGAYTRPPPPPRGVLSNLPNITAASPEDMHAGNGVASEGWIASTYQTVWQLFGIDPAYVRGFFSNRPDTTNVYTISTTMLRCDFSAVTFCTQHRKDLAASAVLVFILYIMVAYFGRLLGVPIIGTVFVFISIPLVIWYSYGMAFTCWPMIPTCLLDDTISWLNSTFPPQLILPPELSTADNCLANSAYSACFKSCADPPMLFQTWRDTLAFGVCSLTVSGCRSLADLIGPRDSLSTALQAKAAIVASGGDSLLGAMNFCFGVTFVNLIPVFVLITLLLTSSVYILYLPCTVIPRFIVVVAQSVAYTHAND